MLRSQIHAFSCTLTILAGTTGALASTQDAPAEPVNSGRVSFSLGLDVTTAYFFRGYVQEDSGLIAQPWAEVGFSLVEASDDTPGVSLTLGTWNSLHSQHTGATEDNIQAWYESDVYAGVALDWESFSLGLTYTTYTYPSSDFNTVEELGLSAGFALPDESVAADILGDISVGLFAEIDNSNVNSEESLYLELGFGPSFDLDEQGATLSVPVTVGFSLDGYYEDSSGDDDFFGYASVSPQVSIPLTSGAYGAWDLTGGASLLVLGNAAEDANGGDSVEVLGFVGVSLSY